ncbi:MAG: ABC transporter substrate-binding protein [Marinibacterium sp.]|nr:ABC transporter substrate-binding protein [Marinibacterium sp.]
MNRLIATTAALALLAGAATAQELTVAAANVSDYLEPGTDHSNVGSQFYTNAFETLIAKDPMSPNNVFGPGLAVSYELLSNNLIELKIREGVKFHNGDDMTVEDVLFSLQAMIKVMHDARIERSKEFFGNITRAEAIDDTTIRVYAKKPEPLMELILAAQQSMIVPKDYLMGLTGRPDVDESSDYIAFGLAPVGTGPYRVAEFTPATRIVYERFEDYWGEPAPYERVTVRQIAELAPRITALVNGEVDLITNVPPDQLDVINSNPSFKAVGGVTPLFHIIYFGPEGDIVTPELRQAMVKSVDRNLLNEALWLGEAVVPNTHTYPNYGEFYTPDIMTFDYDPDGAAKIIADNGLEGTTIPFITHPTYYTNGLLAAQAMQEMWREVGLNVELSVTESWEGWGSKDTMANWSNPMYFADPHGSFGKMWAPEGAGMTRGFWTPSIGMDEWGKMYDAFRFETDVATRNERFADLMEVVKNDAPFLVLYQPFESWGMRADLDWAPYPGHIPYVLDFRAGYIADEANGITK